MEERLLIEFKQHSTFRLKEGQRMVHLAAEKSNRRATVDCSQPNWDAIRQSIIAHLWQYDPVYYFFIGGTKR